MKAIKGILSGLLILISAIVLVVSVPQLLGYKLIIIESGSMEPTLGIGSLCIVNTKKSANVEDIITFRVENDKLITHRVVEIQSDGGYRTMGDHNDVIDSRVVKPEEIEGVTVFNIPKIGILVEAITSRVGKEIILSCIICLLMSIDMLERVINRKQWLVKNGASAN